MEISPINKLGIVNIEDAFVGIFKRDNVKKKKKENRAVIGLRFHVQNKIEIQKGIGDIRDGGVL